MKKILTGVLMLFSIAICVFLYIYKGPTLVDNQISTLIICLIIAGCSALFCFLVGEISHNNSQMDKLWSILPEVYLWIMAAENGMNIRSIIMASLATLWGIRLTYNFARKGAYKLKFWSGKEDYRWEVLRNRKEFQPHWKWVIFNLFFISIYQNLLVFLITLPGIAVMNGEVSFNWIDLCATFFMLLFILYETIADEEQWDFQSKKWSLINGGKKLEDLPYPYNKGFNTIGLWRYSRHPNYLGEQGAWLGFYLFSVGAGLFVFNYSMLGALLLIVLFIGSSAFAEEISLSKYPEYKDYQKSVFKFFPFKKYKK
jgi:steroid 5-alpha reductase family enzyme